VTLRDMDWLRQALAHSAVAANGSGNGNGKAPAPADEQPHRDRLAT